MTNNDGVTPLCAEKNIADNFIERRDAFENRPR